MCQNEQTPTAPQSFGEAVSQLNAYLEHVVQSSNRTLDNRDRALIEGLFSQIVDFLK